MASGKEDSSEDDKSHQKPSGKPSGNADVRRMFSEGSSIEDTCRTLGFSFAGVTNEYAVLMAEVKITDDIPIGKIRQKRVAQLEITNDVSVEILNDKSNDVTERLSAGRLSNDCIIKIGSFEGSKSDIVIHDTSDALTNLLKSASKWDKKDGGKSSEKVQPHPSSKKDDKTEEGEQAE